MATIRVETENGQDEDADATDILDEALSMCKFGWFQVKLFFASFCAVLAFVTVTATSSYILPVAECDLVMDNRLKGILIAVPFLGQIVASIFDGFLIDAFGRRICLVIGNLIIFVSALFEGSSQTYWMLLAIKLIQGFVMSVTYIAVSTMLSEFVDKQFRDKVPLMMGSFMSISLILIACISWVLLPETQWYYTVWEGVLEIHSWNIYIYACSIGSLLACIMFYTLPESPKHLVMTYRHHEALEVLKNIYRSNTGKDKESYPVKLLKCGRVNQNDNMDLSKRFLNNLFHIKQNFDRKTTNRLILLSSTSFISLSTYSSLRLWFPQISATIERYMNDHGTYDHFCEMIAGIRNEGFSENNSTICVPTISGSETYTNAMFLGLISLIFSGVCGFLVDLLGYRALIFIIHLICACTSSGLYFTTSPLQIAMLFSFTNAILNTNVFIQCSIVVKVFPTKLRTFSLAVVILVGQIGSLLGNIIFPFLLEIGCMAPFLVLTVASLGHAGVAFFLPDPNSENKETADK